MIIDSHAHYTEPPRPDRPYDSEIAATNPELLASDWLAVEDLLARAAAAGIDRIVQVTKTKMGYDNRYSLEGAERFPGQVFGVMGRFDPFAPQLEARLREYYAHPKMLAVRFTLLTDRNVRWLEDGTLEPFFAVAQKLAVPVELYAPSQYEAMRRTAVRYPGIRFIVDHMGLRNGPPPRRIEEVFGDWDAAVQLAALPNIWYKVSFFPEAAYRSEAFPFPAAQARFRRLYEAVGAERLVWGANYPPVEEVGAASYREALDFVRVHCPFLSPTDREAILGANLVRCCGK